MTLGELKKYAVKLIDEFSDNSNITSDEDIKNKLNSLFNIAQIELCQIDKIESIMKITQDVPENAINPQTMQEDLYKHNAKDLVFKGVGKCYSFQIKGTGTITICQEGMADINIYNSDNTKFTTYKNILPESKEITITFSGENYYLVRNIAIYDVNYTSISDIPEYQRYIEYTLPEDYYQLNYVTYKGGKGDNYKKIGNILMIPSYYIGEVILNYYRYPTMITDNTPDTFEFELSPKSQMILPYYVASDVLKSDVSANYTSFEAKYNAKLEILNSTKEEDGNIIEIHQILGDI